MRLARLAFLTVVVVVVVVYARRHAPEVAAHLQRVSLRRVGVALSLVALAKVLLGLNALHAMRRIRPETRPAEAFRSYHGTQLAKYLPGGAWHLVGRAVLWRGLGMTARESGVGLAVEHGWLLASALVVGCACLLAEPSRLLGLAAAIARAPGWAWGLLVAVAAASLWAGRRRVRWAAVLRPPAGAVANLAATWVLLGLSLAALAMPVGAGAREVAYCVGAFAFAFVAGLVVPIAPAGLGVREATLALLMQGSGAELRVLIAAALHRVVYLAVEVSFGIGVAVSGWHLRARR